MAVKDSKEVRSSNVALHLLSDRKCCSAYVKVAMGYLPSPLEHSGYNRHSYRGSSRKVSLLSPNTEPKNTN